MIRRASSLSRLSISATFTKARLDSSINREYVIGCGRLQGSISTCCSRESGFKWFTVHFWRGQCRNYHVSSLQTLLSNGSVSRDFSSVGSSSVDGGRNVSTEKRHARYGRNASFELKTDEDVVRFDVGDGTGGGGSWRKVEKGRKDARMSRNKKLNELRFYRLKAKKKMNSPNPEVRIRYKLEKAKRKETWLIEKLRKYEAPKAPPETYEYDPEILTEEERFHLKRTGERKKHYVPVGRRGVFGGVVLNMHLHWKNHETVKVVCKPCRPGQVHQYAEELARLSKGVVIDIMPNDVIIFYRGRNYVQPDVMSPPDTLSKAKALEKYRYEQSLEHTSHFIEKLENELETYLEHVAKYKKEEKSDLVKSL